MGEYDNIGTNGNPTQKQNLIESIRLVKKFGDPELTKQLDSVDYVFTRLPDGIGGQTIKNSGKFFIPLADDFTEYTPEENASLIYHELSHINWDKKHNSIFSLNSKEEEIQTYTDQYILEKKIFDAENKDPETYYQIPSKEEIMQKLNKSPHYKCLPEKEPTSFFEFIKTIGKKCACEATEAFKGSKQENFESEEVEQE